MPAPLVQLHVATFALLSWLSPLPAEAQSADSPSAPQDDSYSAFTLPMPWQEEFWADPEVEALLAMEPEAVADLVPEQAGFHHARCPSCDATEAEDLLSWSVQAPETLTCRACEATFPSEAIPAKVENVVPSDRIEVLPGQFHSYPYHVVEPARARFPGERIYLDAKRDDLARIFLSRFALYAAVRHRDSPAARRDPKAATLASVILLRFAQVYPAYAVHFDQPGQARFLQPADLRPPYREHFRSAKWDHSGALNVPMNLLIAYAILRDDPAIDEAGRLLDQEAPRDTIEEDLFRSSARFLLGHPDPHDERSIYAARGLLAVGTLLGDDQLRTAGLLALDALARRGFYHDGHWRSADPDAHRRVVGLLDGWFSGLIPEAPSAASVPPPAIPAPPLGLVADTDETRQRSPERPGAEVAAILPLARRAMDAPVLDSESGPVHQVSWPPTPIEDQIRRPALLGGAGLARLAAGEGDDAIDLELRGFGDFGANRYDRLAIRLAFGGRTVLGDLDDLPPSRDGWERSSASHNVVVVDGLNQRESPAEARQSTPGSDILFFAADPDLQVVTMSDPRAYPQSCSRYRHTMAVIHDDRARFAVGVFEVVGGQQHDQLFQAPAGSAARWRTTLPREPGPRSLLPASIVYVPSARAEDGRWFLQAFGAFADVTQFRADGPSQAELIGPEGPLLRLHLLNAGPATVFSAEAPDPSGEGRGTLVHRRSAADRSEFSSTLVTLYEPPGTSGLLRVGRVESPEGTALIVLETSGGVEHLMVNSSPGTVRDVPLIDGSILSTDGLLVRVRAEGITLAGGTFAEHGDHRAEQRRAEGKILGSVRSASPGSLGWFEAAGPVADPEALAGRTLIISHGGEASRAWTIAHAENGPDGRALLFVQEEPGFLIDPKTGVATYYQFPGATAPGPHRFIVSRIARSE